MPNEVTPVLCRKSITETSRFIAPDWCESLNSCYLFFTGRNLLWGKNNISQPNCLNQGKGRQNRLC